MEIGGKNKTQNQVIHHENHLVFSDDLEFVGESKSRFTNSDFYIEKKLSPCNHRIKKNNLYKFKIALSFWGKLRASYFNFPRQLPPLHLSPFRD